MGGNVLIPCDSSGRVLELLPILDNVNKLMYLCLVFSTGFNRK